MALSLGTRVGVRKAVVMGVPHCSLAVLVIVAALAVSAQSPPPGITRTELVNNATVMVARLTLAPGARERVHTHPFSAVVVHLDGGLVEMQLGDARATNRRELGFVEFIQKEVPHAAANVGTAAFDVVTIAIKPDRKPGGTAPPVPLPENIVRTTMLENAEARVALVKFAAGAREPVHAHPFDLVLVQLKPGTLEVLVGSDKKTRDYAAGDVLFLPRDVPHAVGSVGKGPTELYSIAIK